MVSLYEKKTVMLFYAKYDLGKVRREAVEMRKGEEEKSGVLVRKI